jgi:cysteinyl-tRNA synthetase
VPVTGLPSDGAENYGGEKISHIRLGAGQSVTLPLERSEQKGGVLIELWNQLRARALVIGIVALVLLVLGATLWWNRGGKTSEGNPSGGTTGSPAGVAETPSPPGSQPAPAITATRSWGTIHNWVYWIAGPDLNQVGGSKFDLAVIDYSADGSADREFSAAQIEAVRHAGCERRVLAYISIGEAEDYRFYWQSGWKAGQPDWIVGQNVKFPGNFAVKFWEPSWQQIVYQYVDRILAHGFDGLYLDKVDAFADPHAAGHEGDMVDFVKRLTSYARARSPLRDDFGVILQNAEELGSRHPDLATAVTGISREETYFQATNEPTSEDERSLVEERLGVFRQDTSGHLVLTVDYADQPDKIKAAYERSRAHGFVPYVTSAIQNKLRLNRGYEPQCSPVR